MIVGSKCFTFVLKKEYSKSRNFGPNFFSTDNLIIGILHTIIDRVTKGVANEAESELENDPVPVSNMGVAIRVTRGVANEDIWAAETTWVGVTTRPANTFSELEDDPVPDSNLGVAICVTMGVANKDIRVAGGVPGVGLPGLVGPG